MNCGFKYKGRNLFVSAIKEDFTNYAIFTLYDIDKIEKIPIDFSEKELAKIELLECLKELSDGEITKSIVAQKRVSLSEFCKRDYDIYLKIKNDLLKELK